MSEQGRVFGLDVLRAFAVTVVVYAHGYRWIEALVPKRIYRAPVIDGVSVFFVLSGFLIGGILLKTMAGPFRFADLRTFWIRRWFRTLPNYFLVLAALVAIEVVISKRPMPSWQYFAFCQNLAWGPPAFFPEAWSLSVEEWFYLTIPLILFLLCRVFSNRQMVFLVVAVSVFMGSEAYRMFVLNHQHIDTLRNVDELLRKPVLARMDSLMLGCIAAWASVNRQDIWRRLGRGALFLGLCLWVVDAAHSFFATSPDFYLRHASFLVVPIGTMLMLPAMSRMDGGASAFGRAISFVARISYSIYLVNLTLVGYIVARAFRHVHEGPPSFLAQFAFYLVLTFGLAWAINVFWERPMMSLRDRRKAQTDSAIPIGSALRQEIL